MINLEKEIREQPEVLGSIGGKNIETVRALVSKAKAAGVKSIYFAARGTSDHAAIYAQYLFALYASVPCGLCTPSAISKYGAKINYGGSLVIGVSQSGQAADVLEVIRDAKSTGAVTASITNNEDSPLAKEADFSLLCGAGAEISIAATKTFTAQMYLLAMICAEWSESEQLRGLLAGVSEAVAETLTESYRQIGGFISDYRNIETGIVLGRGVLYPVALEGALKILETNAVKMKGYPISDFHHGPLAQVKKDDLVILLNARGPVSGDADEILAELDKIGADTLIITDIPEFAAGRLHSVLLPDLGTDIIAPFTAAVTLQLIALRLTEVRGIDPDASKVLNKVTVTI